MFLNRHWRCSGQEHLHSLSVTPSDTKELQVLDDTTAVEAVLEGVQKSTLENPGMDSFLFFFGGGGGGVEDSWQV